MLKSFVRRLLRGVGYDIVGFSAMTHIVARRRALLEHQGIDLVLDVGANIGQYGSALRQESGFRGRIVSFEPGRTAFLSLQQAVARDDNWLAENFALGRTPGELTLNVSSQSVSSSFLTPTQALTDTVAATAIASTETIAVRTLDEVWSNYCRADSRVWLKLDTQGYELEVLNGALESLSKITAIQTELALRPNYIGAPKACEVIDFLESRGFVPVGVEPGFSDPRTGQVFEVDALFLREP